jgi:UDP-glucose 4-epimerase
MNQPLIVVTGGCGYIGSHTVTDLVAHGYRVVSIDSMVRADERVVAGVEKITGQPFTNYRIDLTDREATLELFYELEDVAGVIHFAAFKSVPESTSDPLLYYRNNMNALYNVLEAVREFKVPNFVFSSSCSVYGLVERLPVTEDTPFGVAQCAYARSKQHGEEVIRDFVDAHPSKAVLLRYFNPVGAHPGAEIGEIPIDTPNNLAPFITQTAIGRRKELTVFGTDYPTRDGSCIRDYIHVMDIAHAHTLAMAYLLKGRQEASVEVFNLGTGQGVSVLEAIAAFEQASGQKLLYKEGPRRPGDVIAVYANNEKARKSLGWEIRYGIEDMMLSAWNWEKKMLEKGYYEL